LPKLKASFFNKSPLTAYFNLVGLFLFVPLIILLVISLGFFFFLKKRKRQKKEEELEKDG
jgi:Sec-independent protein secretion pathway component TatC